MHCVFSGNLVVVSCCGVFPGECFVVFGYFWLWGQWVSFPLSCDCGFWRARESRLWIFGHSRETVSVIGRRYRVVWFRRPHEAGSGHCVDRVSCDGIFGDLVRNLFLFGFSWSVTIYCQCVERVEDL